MAFSGTKKVKGIDYDEVSMNNFKSSKNDIPKNFKKKEYRFLIVAEKFQTGFDEPLLHTMYVDKKLEGVQAVQTLSRLNRVKRPYKKDTFVLDFYNNADDIKSAFEPYYTATILSEETDPNKLNDLVDILDHFEVYADYAVEDFFEKFIRGAERSEIDPIIDQSAEVFKNELSLDKQVEFKSRSKSFLRVYSYLEKILDFNNPEWEKLYWFLKYLVPKLFIEKSEDLSDGILDNIYMDSYRSSKDTSQNILLEPVSGELSPIPLGAGGVIIEPELDTLENILNAFNQRFGDIQWTDEDKVKKILTEQLPNEMRANKDIMEVIKDSDKQNAKIFSDKKLEDLIQQYLYSQTEIFKKFTTDLDFQRRYKDFIFETLVDANKQIGV